MEKHATIGVEGLRYAKATVAADGTVTYDSPKLIEGVQKIGLSISSSNEKYYGDDARVDNIHDFESASVTVDTYGIPMSILAELSGSTVDSNGVTIDNVDNDPPKIAMGFKSKKRNGKYRYVWLLLGQKMPSDSEEYTTKTNKTDPKTATMSFEFLQRKDGNWRFRADDEDAETAGLTPDAYEYDFLTSVYDGSFI